MGKASMYLNRVKIRISWKLRTVRCFFGKFRKPLQIEWEEFYKGPAPVCPRCHELVYYQEKCCFCGQRFLPGSVTVGSLLEKKAED